jgi:putative transposase
MYADLSMQADLLKEALGKNVWSAPLLQGFRAWPSGLRKCIRPLISQPLLATRP